MGLAGGIVRKVFSKSPCCSSAGGSRGHSEKHRRRWSSLRLYLCGEEMNAAAEVEEDDEDGGETVSVKSFETCCVMPEEAPHVVVVPVANRLRSDADNDSNPAGEPEEEKDRSRQVPGAGEQRHGHVVVRVPDRAREEEAGAAATLIQSAFRGFMARRQLRQGQGQQEMDGGAQDQQEASVATSVLVQVGEESLSLGNLRLSEEESASVVQQQQQRSSGGAQNRPSRPPPAPAPAAFRVKEEWDDSTVSSNVSRMRIQSRIEATTRRERALAYAFSQQLRSCGGGAAAGGSSRKRSSARAAEEEQGERNVGWSWLERWMATRQAAEPQPQPQPAADDCMSRNADAGSATAPGRRVVVVRRRSSNANDLAVEEKESCGSNDVVSVVSFDGSSSLRGGAAARTGLTCHNKPTTTGAKSRLKAAGRSLPRRKQVAAASDHRFQARSHKVSKKGHHRVEQAPPHKDRLEAAAGFDFHDACQPPTDY